MGWKEKKSLSDEEIVRGEGLGGGGLVKYAKQARKCDEGRGKFDKVRLEWEDGEGEREREREDERREEEEEKQRFSQSRIQLFSYIFIKHLQY